MGQIQRSKRKTTIRSTVDEVLTARVAASKDVTFILAEMIRKFAQMRAAEKNIELPQDVISISFDPESCKFVVAFSHEYKT